MLALAPSSTATSLTKTDATARLMVGPLQHAYRTPPSRSILTRWNSKDRLVGKTVQDVEEG